jgi:hypothetical protein
MIKFAPPARNIKELNYRNRKVFLICTVAIAVFALVCLILIK